MAARAVLQLLQEQNERAESESMRLREKMERDREQARNQAVQFAQAGFSIGDIEKAVPHLDLQGYTLAKMVADKQKRDKQAAEAEAEGAAQGGEARSVLAQLLQNTNGNVGALDPRLVDDLKVGLLAGGDSSPDSFISRYAALARSNQGAQIANANAANQLAIQHGIAQREAFAPVDRRIAADNALAAQRSAEHVTGDAAERTLLREGFADRLIDARLAPASVPFAPGYEYAQTRKQIEAEVKSAFGPEWRSQMALIDLSAKREADAQRPVRDILAEYAREGVTMSPGLVKQYQEGKAFEDVRTGLLVPGQVEGESTRALVAANEILMATAQLDKAIADFAETSQASAATGTIETLSERLGDSDPNWQRVDSARELLKIAVIKARSGAAFTKEELAIYERAVGRVASMQIKNGRLLTRERIDALRANTENSYYSRLPRLYPRGVVKRRLSAAYQEDLAAAQSEQAGDAAPLDKATELLLEYSGYAP
jgi:hypothetical protein